MARPTKLDPQRTKILIEAIEGGMNYEDACRLARISYKTFTNWIRKGKKAKSGAFCQFFHDIEYAKAKGLAFHLSVINNAARNGDWHASRYICQARHGMIIPKEIAPSVQIQIAANEMNVQTLLQEVTENAKKLGVLNAPVIDLDET